MSLGYDISIKLKQSYNNQSVQEVLARGSSLGFVYYKYTWGTLNIDLSPMNIQEAAANVMKENEDGLQCLTLQINDTYATLHIRNDFGYLSLMLTTFYYPWTREYEDGLDVDIGRYAKVMLDLVSDFKIIEMKIEKD